MVGLLKRDIPHIHALSTTAVLPKTWAVKAAASLREFLAQWWAAASRVHSSLETLMVELEWRWVSQAQPNATQCHSPTHTHIHHAELARRQWQNKINQNKVKLTYMSGQLKSEQVDPHICHSNDSNYCFSHLLFVLGSSILNHIPFGLFSPGSFALKRSPWPDCRAPVSSSPWWPDAARAMPRKTNSVVRSPSLSFQMELIITHSTIRCAFYPFSWKSI